MTVPVDDDIADAVRFVSRYSKLFAGNLHKPGFPGKSLSDRFIPDISPDTLYFLYCMLFMGFNRCILFRYKPVRQKEGFKVDFKEQTFDIAALGELLIDFTPVKVQPGMNPCFEQNPGGAPANVAVAGAKSGCRTAFIGAVGKDSFGAFLRQELDSRGVNTDYLTQKPSGTTLAFVHLDKTGNRSFSFYRDPGADTLLESCDLQDFPFEKCRIFHTGSLSLTAEPARSATFSGVCGIGKNLGRRSPPPDRDSGTGKGCPEPAEPVRRKGRKAETGGGNLRGFRLPVGKGKGQGFSCRIPGKGSGHNRSRGRILGGFFGRILPERKKHRRLAPGRIIRNMPVCKCRRSLVFNPAGGYFRPGRPG